MCQLSVGRIKRQGNKTLVAARLVLLLAQSHQMIHSILYGLYVAVEHSRVGLETGCMDFAGKFEPPGSIAFVGANQRPCGFAEDLGPATGTGIQARIYQTLNHILVRKSVKM